MALYLIAFNDEWVPDHTLEELREKATSARAVIEEMTDAGVFVFSDGDRRVDRCAERRPEQRLALTSPTGRSSRPRSISAASRSSMARRCQARYWAEDRGRGWLAAEVHRFPHRIALSTDPQSETLA